MRNHSGGRGERTPAHIGTGLAGGSWEVISGIVTEELVNQCVPVTVYELPS